MAGKGPISTVGTVIGWVLLACAVFAIMVLWNWDPIAFVTSVFERISDVFLSWDWFRRLVGPPA